MNDFTVTALMKAYETAFHNGIGLLIPLASKLLVALATIDLIWGVLANLEEQNHIRTLITKIVKYGFFAWIVTKYDYIITEIMRGFLMVGFYASGEAYASAARALMLNPGKFVELGVYYAKPILEYMKHSGVSLTTNLTTSIGTVGLLIILCFIIMGIQVFLAYLEFYIVGALALILIPFGTLQRTSFIAEKAIGAVISFGIRLMIMAFIISVAFPLLQKCDI